MLTAEAGVILLTMISKLNFKIDEEFITELSSSQGSDSPKDKVKAAAAKDAAVGKLGSSLLNSFVVNFPKIKEEIFELLAAYKDVSQEEAKKLPLMPTIKEVMADEDIKEVMSSFFSAAL